ncbi:hypothetical protein BDF20DRAFT_878247 [Mycotypha africana]|uniref:uncharacterized protein n=1 Tax=Mycotypha africana TaxID=64632 RepID=UPI002300A0D3|nr:uncharacterized protein BDF20DRAFT_878247 [Mycotypha africana]KAI8975366.1 hypothetical protein BDF20DRAFT_878247 [Mycotypha africana]
MIHLLGVNLPDKKLIGTALQYFYGIGESTALKLCQRLSISPTVKVAELSDVQITELTNILSNMTIESDLKRQVRDNIMHHRNIGNYTGKRHAMGLPVRGQRTRNNAQTAKRLNGRIINRRSYMTQTSPAADMWARLQQQKPLEQFIEKWSGRL